MTLSLTFKVTGAKFNAVAFILLRLSLYHGAAANCKEVWPHIKGLQLVDPQFSTNDPIELLLGAEVSDPSRGPSQGSSTNSRRSTYTSRMDSLRRLRRQPIGNSTQFLPVHGGPRAGRTHTMLLGTREGTFRSYRPHARRAAVRRYFCTESQAQRRRAIHGTITIRLSGDHSYWHSQISGTIADLHGAKVWPFSVRGALPRLSERIRESQTHGTRTRHIRITRKENMLLIASWSASGVKRQTSGRVQRVIRSGESLNSQLLIGAVAGSRRRAHAMVLAPLRVRDGHREMYRQILVFPKDRDHQRILWRWSDSRVQIKYRHLWPRVRAISRYLHSPSTHR